MIDYTNLHVTHIHQLRYRNLDVSYAASCMAVLLIMMAMHIHDDGLRDKELQELMLHEPWKMVDLIKAMRTVGDKRKRESLEEDPCEFHDHSDTAFVSRNLNSR
jgi:hypothetical protein